MYTHTVRKAILNKKTGVSLVISGAVPADMPEQGVRKAFAH